MRSFLLALLFPIVSHAFLSPTHGGGGGAATWGGITGTLSSQTDLQSALNAKLDLSGGSLTGTLNIGSDTVLNPDGSGYFANNQFSWDTGGEVTFTNATVNGTLDLNNGNDIINVNNVTSKNNSWGISSAGTGNFGNAVITPTVTTNTGDLQLESDSGQVDVFGNLVISGYLFTNNTQLSIDTNGRCLGDTTNTCVLTWDDGAQNMTINPLNLYLSPTSGTTTISNFLNVAGSLLSPVATIPTINTNLLVGVIDGDSWAVYDDGASGNVALGDINTNYNGLKILIDQNGGISLESSTLPVTTPNNTLDDGSGGTNFAGQVNSQTNLKAPETLTSALVGYNDGDRWAQYDDAGSVLLGDVATSYNGISAFIDQNNGIIFNGSTLGVYTNHNALDDGNGNTIVTGYLSVADGINLADNEEIMFSGGSLITGNSGGLLLQGTGGGYVSVSGGSTEIASASGTNLELIGHNAISLDTDAADNITMGSGISITAVGPISITGNSINPGKALGLDGSNNLISLPPGSTWGAPATVNHTGTVTLNNYPINPYTISTGASTVTINGIFAGVDGQMILIENNTGNAMTFNHLSGSATQQKIYCPGATAFTLPNNEIAVLINDAANAQWKLQPSSLAQVANGGTGLNAVTAYGLLAGGTTSTNSLQQVGITSGVLQSNGGSALPSFTNNPTFTSLVSGGTAPTIAAGAGAGTSPTVSVSGHDMAMAVSVTTGTLPTGTNAVVATVTFGASKSSAPHCVLYPANANTSLLSGVSMVFVTETTTTMVITSGTTALTAATAYKWEALCIQ